mmetsp:Transcript_20151/g.45664  ORF Transcript_20151/g.45664 Transcript_20151/m.45664 type:complete len:551 (-) Transcript_20151:155-1807(-)
MGDEPDSCIETMRDGCPRPKKKHASERDIIMECSQRFGVFYGYVVLFAATVGKIFTSPGQSPCIGVAIGSVRESLGFSRSHVAFLYLLATSCSALSLPFTTGRAIDAWGTRKMVVAIALGLGGACFVISAAASSFQLLLAFFMLRFFGQGSLMNVSVTQINLWWVKRRGTMMGGAGACVSLGMLAVVPAFMDHNIETVGWRVTYRYMGCLCIFFMAPFGWAFYRFQPEKYGMLPDGHILTTDPICSSELDRTVCYGSKDGTSNITKNSHALPSPKLGENVPEKDQNRAVFNTEDDGTGLQTAEDWDVKETLHNPTFWVFAISQLSQALTGTAFWFHLQEVLEEAGLSIEIRKAMYPFLAASSVLARIISGHLADSVEARWLVFGGLGTACAALSLVPYMGYPGVASDGAAPDPPGGGGVFLVFVVGMLQTTGSAFQMTAGNVVYANSFGRKHLGTIQTVASSCGVLGSAFGPFLWGTMRDLTGSYTLAFRFGAILPASCAIGVFLRGKRPRRMQARRIQGGERWEVRNDLEWDKKMYVQIGDCVGSDEKG